VSIAWGRLRTHGVRMKITLDLTELQARGALTPEEAKRLEGLALKDTGALGVNILMGFGVVAVALGAGVLVPDAWTAVVIGLLLFGTGLALRLSGNSQWDLFTQICMTVGALAAAGGAYFLAPDSILLGLGICLALAAAAAVAGSGLLAALAVLQLTTVLGASTAYWHATYGLSIFQPTLTIVALGVLAIGLYLWSLRLPPRYERVAIIGARAAILMINLAFLVGSLFGDKLTETLSIPDWVFSVVWAVLLVGVGLWAVRRNRRWVVNAAAVFGGIHFYTQWFEQLGASPLSILGGGVLLIAFGFGLRALNRGPAQPAPAA
jgi:iron complex transport system permease protein